MSSPLVTGIVPVYNGERFLDETLDSALAQSYEPLEIVLVDDGSTDATPQICRRYGQRIRYFRQDNAGPSAARNLGLRRARGEFFAFLDADDLWLPEKVAHHMSHFAARPTIDISVSRLMPFWSEELRDEEERLRSRDLARAQTGLFLPSSVVRRSVMEAVGPLNADLRHGEGNEWFIRAIDRDTVIELLPEVLHRKRLHDGNMTRHEAAAARDWLPELAKMVLDRRRRLEPGAADPFRLFSGEGPP
jgi:glycosyltransferase involved in cell wall biosynthesis